MTFISADLEMAIAYWNIVLKDRFRFLEIWCQFLQVSWIYLCFWGEGGYMEHVHTGKSRGTLLVSPGIKKLRTTTVKPLIMDSPKGGQPLYSRQIPCR